MQDIKSKKGFTIIEVVLVLAIAGLIFLMVFIALPSMQRTQRDRQRTQDYTALSSNITNYLTNNNGNLPGTCALGSSTGICKSPDKYINTTGKDQSGNAYKLAVIDCGATATSNSNPSCTASPLNNGVTELENNNSEIEVYVVRKAKCDPDNQGKALAVTSTRAFAIIGQLETGVFCTASE